MKIRKVSIILFYDNNGNFLLQDRREFDRRKYGEEFGFFGGKIEWDETPEQALLREIREELNIELKSYKFFKKYTQEIREFDKIIEKNMFIGEMPDLRQIKCSEGKPIVVKSEDALKLKMIPGDNIIIKDLSNLNLKSF